MRFLFLLAVLLGCSDAPAPFVPTGGGGPIGRGGTSGGGGSSDAGVDGSVSDAAADAMTSSACIALGPADPLNNASVFDVTPAFQPRSAIAYYEPRGCDGDQRLVFLLTEDPTCNLLDRYFAIVVDTAEIGRLVTEGISTPLASGGFEVFYVEGAGTTSRQLWTQCEGSSGLVTFTDLEPEIAGADQQVSFDVTLTRCDGLLPAVQVVGSILAPLEATFNDICG